MARSLTLTALLAIIGCTKQPNSKPTVREEPATAAVVVSDGRETIERGVCGPPATPGQTQDEFSRVWQALPPRLRQEFPNQPGVFALERSGNSSCLDEIFPQASMDYQSSDIAVQGSCWRPERSEARLRPVVHIQDDARTLHAHLLGVTTSAYFEFYFDDVLGLASDRATLRQLQLRKGEDQLRNFIADVRMARKLLARAYLDDIKSSSLVGTYSKRFRTSPGLLAESVAFQNFLVGQMVDSYYCNSATVRLFNANEMVQTRGAFMPFVDFLGAPWFATATAH